MELRRAVSSNKVSILFKTCLLRVICLVSMSFWNSSISKCNTSWWLATAVLFIFSSKCKLCIYIPRAYKILAKSNCSLICKSICLPVCISRRLINIWVKRCLFRLANCVIFSIGSFFLISPSSYFFCFSIIWNKARNFVSGPWLNLPT